jgi:hypothetical protein
MKDICEMDNKIEIVRNKLNYLMVKQGSVLDLRILYVSKKMDELLNQYYRLEMESH